MISELVKYRMHAIKIIARRMRQMKFWGIGVFIVISIGFLIFSMLLVNTIQFTKVNIVLVQKQPLQTPIMVNAILVSLYLSFTCAISIAREYDKGTLELMLYGPVDEDAFIFGNFFAQLIVFIISILAALVLMLVCIWQVNLNFQWNILLMFLATLFMAAQLISLGILLAVVGGKTRSSLIYFILAIFFLAAIPLADMVISSFVTISSTTVNDPVLIIRDVLAVVNNAIRWLSPYALLRNALEGITQNSIPAYLLNMTVLLFETILMLIGSVFTLKKKGVRS